MYDNLLAARARLGELDIEHRGCGVGIALNGERLRGGLFGGACFDVDVPLNVELHLGLSKRLRLVDGFPGAKRAAGAGL